MICAAIFIAIPFQGMNIFDRPKLELFLVMAAIVPAIYVAVDVQPLIGLAMAMFGLSWVFHGFPDFGYPEMFFPFAALMMAYSASKKSDFALLCLRIFAWVQVVFCFYQLCGGQTFGANNPWFLYKAQGSFGHPILVGCFFAMIWPVAFKKWSLAESAVFMLFAFLSKETTAVCAVLGSIMFFYWRLYEWKTIFAAVGFAVIFLACSHYFPSIGFFNFDGRHLPWGAAAKFIKTNPFGYGPGSWLGLYRNWGLTYMTPNGEQIWTRVHNDWLQLLFEGGLQSLLPMLAGVYLLLKKLPLWAGASIAALCVNALGSFPLHHSGLALLTCVILMLGIEEVKKCH